MVSATMWTLCGSSQPFRGTPCSMLSASMTATPPELGGGEVSTSQVCAPFSYFARRLTAIEFSRSVFSNALQSGCKFGLAQGIAGLKHLTGIQENAGAQGELLQSR